MQVPAFLKQVQLCLIADVEFVAPVADVDSRRINLITVSQMYAVEITTYLYCYGSRRTIRQPCIHHPLLVCVLQPPRDICPPGDAISTSQDGCVYGKKRIFQPNIVSTR